MAKENAKIKALHALLEFKDITAFGQIFRNKHFTIGELAKLVKKSPAYMKKCVDDPGQFKIEDLAKIAEALDIARKQITELVLDDYKGKPR